MSALLCVLFVMLPAPAAPADPVPDTKTELAKWQGTWEVELMVFEGKEKPAKDRNISKVVVKDDVWEVHFKDSDKPVKGTLKIVLDGKMKGLDVTVGSSLVKAAYIIDGDRALLSVGDIDGERPKDFSTSQDVGTGGILVYKRVKK
jgi:uncharacterized protein (TIGR03067 family)